MLPDTVEAGQDLAAIDNTVTGVIDAPNTIAIRVHGSVTGAVLNDGKISFEATTPFEASGGQGSSPGEGTGGIEIEGDAGSITNSATGIIIGPSDASVAVAPAIQVSGNVAGAVVNAGHISQVGTGLDIGGTAASASNSGSILANFDGAVFNNVTGDIVNTGTLTGGAPGGPGVGLYVIGAVGGTVKNTDAISGGLTGFQAEDSTHGKGQTSVLGAFDNSGTITGGQESVRIAQVKGDFTNSGEIDGATGLDIADVGGTLTNSGTLKGTGAGALVLHQTFTQAGTAPAAATIGAIFNTASGQILGLPPTSGSGGAAIYVRSLESGLFTNAGLISSQGDTAIVVGDAASAADPAPPPANLDLDNTGRISGGGGVALDYRNAGAASTITQAGGAISGDIDLSAHGDTLDVTGGTISGAISGDSAANGANAGTLNFKLGASGAFTTDGAIDVAAVNLDSGALTMANDVTVSGSFTNDATLRFPGTGAFNITGRSSAAAYVQGAAGDLIIAVTPAAVSELDVAGAAKLGGAVTFDYAPGTYVAKTYTFLHSTGLGGSTFATIAASTGGPVPKGLSQSVTYTTTDADLVLSAASPPPPPPSADRHRHRHLRLRRRPASTAAASASTASASASTRHRHRRLRRRHRRPATASASAAAASAADRHPADGRRRDLRDQLRLRRGQRGCGRRALAAHAARRGRSHVLQFRG